MNCFQANYSLPKSYSLILLSHSESFIKLSYLEFKLLHFLYKIKDSFEPHSWLHCLNGLPLLFKTWQSEAWIMSFACIFKSAVKRSENWNITLVPQTCYINGTPYQSQQSFQSLQVTSRSQLGPIRSLLRYTTPRPQWAHQAWGEPISKISHLGHGPSWTRNKNAQEENIKDKIAKKKQNRFPYPKVGVDGAGQAHAKKWN